MQIMLHWLLMLACGSLSPRCLRLSSLNDLKVRERYQDQIFGRILEESRLFQLSMLHDAPVSDFYSNVEGSWNLLLRRDQLGFLVVTLLLENILSSFCITHYLFIYIRVIFFLIKKTYYRCRLLNTYPLQLYLQ